MKAKNILVIFSVILAFFTMALAGGGAGKITICHVPPGNPANAHAITISRNAWENGHSPHNAHSLDYEGECNEVPKPTATNVQPTNTPVPTDPRPTDVPVPTVTHIPPTTRPNPSATHVPSATATTVPTYTPVSPTDEPTQCICVLEATVTPTPVLYSCQASTDGNDDTRLWIVLVVGAAIGGGLVGTAIGRWRRG
ncbi:MAG: hypothetical protein QQN63_02405 [Nitrosopumilus sp.]